MISQEEVDALEGSFSFFKDLRFFEENDVFAYNFFIVKNVNN